MVVESPAILGIPLLGGGLADVVEQGAPACPDVSGAGGDIVKHLEGMVKIVLVAASMARLHAAHRLQLGQDVWQHARLHHQFEAYRRLWRRHDFLQLVLDALAGEDAHAVGVACHSHQRLRRDAEA